MLPACRAAFGAQPQENEALAQLSSRRARRRISPAVETGVLNLPISVSIPVEARQPPSIAGGGCGFRAGQSASAASVRTGPTGVEPYALLRDCSLKGALLHDYSELSCNSGRRVLGLFPSGEGNKAGERRPDLALAH